jgi:subtilase family serine protease
VRISSDYSKLHFPIKSSLDHIKNQRKIMKHILKYTLLAPAGALLLGSSGFSEEILKPMVTWVRSQPAQPGVPAASHAPDDTTFGVVHASFPSDITAAYDIDPLYSEGLSGAGQTIVIVDSYGSPTALEDLQAFSDTFGLPSPNLTIIHPDGKPTVSKAMHDVQTGWAVETSLDLQWAHAIAPGAKIVLIAANPAETAGVQGLSSMFKGIQYAIEHYPGSIISQSFGCAEQSFQSAAGVQLAKYEKIYQQAVAARCTVLSAAGDWGTANASKQGSIYAFPTVIWPASSPSVTAVGGTWLQYGWRWNPTVSIVDFLNDGSLFNDFLNYDSVSTRTEAVWREDWIQASTGGGLSSVFSTPAFQAALPATLLQGHRGVPDVSWNAAVDGGVLVYFSQFGWLLVGGTSASTPELAGVVALANQLRAADGKAPIGHLAPALYSLPGSDFNDIVPETFGSAGGNVTLGDNSRYGFGIDPSQTTIGYDLTTGRGSPKAHAFVHDLATLVP